MSLKLTGFILFLLVVNPGLAQAQDTEHEYTDIKRIDLTKIEDTSSSKSPQGK